MPTRSARSFVWAPLLPAAMIAATLIYNLIAVLGPDIVDEFDFSKARLGWVLAIYSIISAALSPVAGQITDRIGARRAIMIIFASAGLGFLLFSRAGGFLGLVGASLVIAIGQALGNPGTNKLIATEFAVGGRGLITGIKQSGVQFGTLIAGLTFPAIAAAWGWRQVPLLVGLFLLGVGVYSFVVLPKAHIEPALSAEAKLAGGAKLPKSVPLLTVYALLMGLGGSPTITFLPLYAVEQIDISEISAGWLVAISGAVGMPARIGAAVLADRRAKPYSLLFALSVIAMLATAAMLSANFGGYPLLALGAALSGLGVSAWNSVAMLAVINDSGPGQSGKASGFVLAGFLSGLAISPPLFGFTVDRTGSYNFGFICVACLFGLAALTMVSAFRAGR